MNSEIKLELKKLRSKINEIPFSNKMKSIYTLDYYNIVEEISKNNTLDILDQISVLNYLIDNNC